MAHLLQEHRTSNNRRLEALRSLRHYRVFVTLKLNQWTVKPEVGAIRADHPVYEPLKGFSELGRP